MMRSAVSFDFHDTIAIAPSWFQLEVRHLVSATHAALVAGGHLPPGPSASELDAAYRALRLEIHEHGHERDALGCVVEVLGRLDQECPAEPTAGVIEQLMVACLEDCRPRPGIAEAIRQLAEAGLPIGITSSAVYHPFLLWTLDRFGLSDSIRSVVTSASCGYYKSRPEIYQATAAALGVEPGGLIHIGDSFRWDVAAPHQLGIRPIWLNLQSSDPPQPELPALTITSLDGLAERVLQLLAC